ncbi:hypothetical protein [Arthrobacter agilis]|uniref:hypothetical protein n=1 Tax=Arthrobacter agilis TaxID=37921 RepID=UPI00278B339B|nr:hypothetical protein [Arthrobacter agilis]MDQ0736744.1 hypothetical protein [Arthrobacter agilis]
MTTQQIDWTDRDIECAQAVLTGSAPADGPLPTLTDEEIVALDGVDRSQLVPLPFLDKNDGDKRLMATVALRGLLAKQIAYPRAKGQAEPTGLGAVPEITGILTLRRTGRRIVSGERRSAAGTHWLFGYLHGDRVLEEQISDTGVHAFEVYPAAQLVERLGVLVDPQGAAAGDGTPDTLPQERFEEEAPTIFAGALAVTTVVAGGIEPDSQAVLTVYASADRVRTLDAATGEAGITYTVAEVSPGTLRRRLAEDLVRL